jgi:hypothetical protein
MGLPDVAPGRFYFLKLCRGEHELRDWSLKIEQISNFQPAISNRSCGGPVRRGGGGALFHGTIGSPQQSAREFPSENAIARSVRTPLGKVREKCCVENAMFYGLFMKTLYPRSPGFDARNFLASHSSFSRS